MAAGPTPARGILQGFPSIGKTARE